MADKELLELAAKAAGYEINFEEPVNNYYPHGYDDDGDVGAWWNPLTNDGDALRLVANLGLWITREGVDIHVRHFAGHYLAGPTYVTERTDSPDHYTSTRRAIVRAAAEIGKAMP